MCCLLYNVSELTQRENNLIHMAISVFLVLWCLSELQPISILKKMQWQILYIIGIVGFTFLNHGLSSRTITAILTGTVYFLLFWMCSVIAHRNGIEAVIGPITGFFFLFTIVFDAIVLFTGTKGIGISSAIASYFFGNKFTVSYTHMMLIALFHIYAYKERDNRSVNLAFLAVSAYSVAICMATKCMTGVVGCVVVWLICVLMVNSVQMLNYLSRPGVFVSVIVISSVVVLNSSRFINNPLFIMLMNNVFHRSVTLTGRTDTFRVAWEGIRQSPLIGHGINSTYVEDILTWGNAQNGLLKVILDYGFIGVLLFLKVCWNSFTGKMNHRLIEISLIAFLYGIAACATVEICFGNLFFLGLALLRMSRVESAE